MRFDREATRQALMESVKIGKVSGMRAGVEALKMLANLGKDLRASDVKVAAYRLEAIADKMDAEIKRPKP